MSKSDQILELHLGSFYWSKSTSVQFHKIYCSVYVKLKYDVSMCLWIFVFNIYISTKFKINYLVNKYCFSLTIPYTQNYYCSL